MIKKKKVYFFIGCIVIGVSIWILQDRKNLKNIFDWPNPNFSPGSQLSEQNDRLISIHSEEADQANKFLKINDLRSIAAQLSLSIDPEANYKLLLELEKLLRSMTSTEATKLILGYLNTGEDGSTHLDFIINPDGYLEMAPTLRTFLLDQIADINPQAAVELARNILGTSVSGDEWAIALRNYVWGQPDQDMATDIFLNKKIDELLSHKEWLKSPTAGFLQAFDAAVYSNNQAFVRKLGVIDSDPDLPLSTKYAANLAGARMAEQNFVSTACTLMQDTQLPQDSTFRASIMTHADLSEDAAVRVVADYMIQDSISIEEKKRFLEGFPNIVDIYSNNLLTKQVAKPLHNNEISDLRALDFFKHLRQDPAFQPCYAELDRAIQRMEEFEKSIKRGKEQERMRTPSSTLQK